MSKERFQRTCNVDCTWKDLGTLTDLYKDACRKGDYVDFDRMLSLLVAVMQLAPGVLAKYHRRYRCAGDDAHSQRSNNCWRLTRGVQYQPPSRYVLVDEFQDVNEPQFEIVRMLAQGAVRFDTLVLFLVVTSSTPVDNAF